MLRCLEWAARRAASPLAARAARAPAPPAGHLRARLSPTRAYGHSRALGAPHGQPECAGHACAAAPAPMVRAARRLVRGCKGGAAERGAQGSGEDRLPALSAASPASAPEARGGGPLKCAQLPCPRPLPRAGRARAAADAAAGAGGRVAAQRARDSGRAPEGRSGCCRDEARSLHPRAALRPRLSVWRSSALAWAGAQRADPSTRMPPRSLPAPSHPQRAPPGRRANSERRSCVGGAVDATYSCKAWRAAARWGWRARRAALSGVPHHR